MKSKSIFVLLVLISCCFFASACAPSEQAPYAAERREYTFCRDGVEYSIPYISISGLENPAIAAQANEVLKTVVEGIAGNTAEIKTNAPVISAVYQDSDYLSVLYEVQYDESAERVKLGKGRVGIVIDIHTGNRLFLDDFFDSPDELFSCMSSYKTDGEFFVPIEYAEAVNIFNAASLSEAEYAAQKDASAFDFMLRYTLSKPTFYLDGNEIVIIRDNFDLNDARVRNRRWRTVYALAPAAGSADRSLFAAFHKHEC